jgi:hypothetical protein
MSKVKFTKTNFSLSVEYLFQLDSFIVINRNAIGMRGTFGNHTEFIEFKRIVGKSVAVLDD